MKELNHTTGTFTRLLSTLGQHIGTMDLSTGTGKRADRREEAAQVGKEA
jgi:hypothetical protein